MIGLKKVINKRTEQRMVKLLGNNKKKNLEARKLAEKKEKTNNWDPKIIL